MIQWSSYWRLLRFDKPAGTLLLWYPTAWALWFANEGFPPMRILFLMFLGTVIMRAAGCVVNDMADRRIDIHVTRTKSRPLTAGEVSLSEAFLLVTVLLCGAFGVVVNLPIQCFYISLMALFITILYPFCKRFLNAPQMVLGLAFSMGIPIAYAASGVPPNSSFIILCFINFAWILAYDTMYAMTDRADDLKIGVKSTAIYFADYDRLIIGMLLFLLHSLWLYWAFISNADPAFYTLWFTAIFILIFQQKLIHQRKPEDCFKAFKVSVYYGLLMWLAVGMAA